MDITEKDLEDLIFEDLTTRADGLSDRGFEIPLLNYQHFRNKMFWYRQVQLKGYGIADIIGFTRQNGVLFVEVMELKNRPLKPDDFEQVCRYRQAVVSIIKNSFNSIESSIHCTLVGPSIDEGHYIHNVVYGLSLIEFTFTIRGFEFDTHDNAGWIKSSDEKIHLKDIKASNEVIIPGWKSIKILKHNGEKVY